MSLLETLRAVRDGEDRRRPSPGLAAGEDGLISLIAAVTVLMFLALAILLGNALMVVNEKMETQSAADAVAQSSATQMARSLNAVAGVQHLTGELLALVVVHNAIGGDNLPSAGTQDTKTQDKVLDAAEKVLRGTGGFPFAYNQVSQSVDVEAALLKAHKQLKLALAAAYGLQAAGQVVIKIPFGQAIGAAMIAVAIAMEAYIQAEWLALKGLEIFAKGVALAVKGIFQAAPRAAEGVIARLELETPGQMSRTAAAVAKLNNAEGALYPDGIGLPIRRDPLSNASSKGEMKKSQLVRASWPYVAYHRSLLLDLTGWMIFSGFRGHYKEETEEFMLKKSYEVYSEQRVYFRVMDGLKGPDRKGEEPWTRSPREAERRFAVVGFARRPAPTPWGGALFRPTRGPGLIAYSQALVYNANAQRPGAPGRHQQEIGWDTLNWRSPVGGSNAYEYPNAGGGSARGQFPEVRLNWQAKLIPITRLGEAKGRLPGPFRDLLRDLDESSPMAKTH